MRRTLLLALSLLLLAVPPAVAGLYSLDDPCPFAMNPDGTAAPLPHPLFNARLTDRETPGVPFDPKKAATFEWATANDQGEPLLNAVGERVAVAQGSGRVAQRLAARWPKVDDLRGADLLSHTAALIQVGASQQALNLLDRRRVGGDYALRANRAHAFATTGQWADAVTNLPDEPDSPTPPPGTSEEQFAWQRRLDQSAYLRWLKARERDAGLRRSPADPTQTPLLLFHTTDGLPIRYWDGATEAGKLPADAVAMVQQLLLWEPNDNLLRWTLAEVYFAKGNVRAAEATYRSLTGTDGRNFGGPRLLDGLRQRVAVEEKKLPEEDVPLSVPEVTPDPDPPPPPPGPPAGLVFGLIDPLAFTVAVLVFAVVMGLMLTLQVRAAMRRVAVARRGRPPGPPQAG